MKKNILLVLAIIACSVATSFADDAPLRSGDSFDLRIGGVPPDDQGTISGNYTIDGGGTLNLPLIGKIQASGKTPSQIQSLVERTYVEQGIFTHPSISLTMAANARFVSVGGSVKAPGRVSYSADMTVFSAISAAGDFNEFANQKRVKLMRGGTVQVIDCKRIRDNPSLDVKVLPGDNIQVPESIF